MMEFLLTGLLGSLLILICVMLTYEVLRFIWGKLPTLDWKPRSRVLLVVAGVFAGHIINIWIFGAVYYALILFTDTGSLVGTVIDRGEYALDLFGCIYFSAVTYTTVGFGDITPEGGLRMISGVESLTGFILIGWTASFTYLAMEKFWGLPHHRGRK